MALDIEDIEEVKKYKDEGSFRTDTVSSVNVQEK